MAKITNLQEYRAQKQRQEQEGQRRRRFAPRRLLRLFALIALAAAVGVFVYYANQGEVQDYIRQNVTGSSVGTGYPLALSSKNAWQLEMLDGNPLVLTETNLQVYDGSARLLRDVQHGYKDPGLALERKYALLYDQGANGFQLGNKKETLFEKKITETILTGDVSSQGKVGIAAARSSFGSSFTVYSRSGETVFEWYTTEAYLSCVGMDNDRAAAGALATDSQGSFFSYLYCFAFDATEPLCKVELPGELIYDVSISGSRILVITDQNLYQFSRTGSLQEQFSYEGKKLAAFALSEDCAALALADSQGDYRQELYLFLSPERCTLSGYETRQTGRLKVAGSQVVLLEGGLIQAVDGWNGEILTTLTMNEDDRDAALADNMIYVLSASSVERYALNGEDSPYNSPEGEEEAEEEAPSQSQPGIWQQLKELVSSLFTQNQLPEDPLEEEDAQEEPSDNGEASGNGEALSGEPLDGESSAQEEPSDEEDGDSVPEEGESGESPMLPLP